ncbi:DUF4350 domain-containing protein [Natronococcus occultus]|uniref:DUF4350 domain-containing protein n=1 Tax=Natronococcus occultus SP4 TaxID=694430 RepID=L0K3Y1_9EURY|nr:DUF4350 domain-containing protein [Natronococcus occultus]AGB39260.1 hypothetical protein Natoc_3535 [Natronococcus occultus SP4]
MLHSVDRRRLALLAFAAAVVLATVWFGATASEAHDPYNPGSEGTSELRQTVADDPDSEDATVGNDDLEDADAAIAIPGPETDESTADAAAFVREGGTLIVLADDPSADDVLESVGAEARLEDGVLRDDRHHHRGPAMPTATETADHELTAGVDRLGLDRATAIEPNDATVLATTSESSYLVDDPDATRDEETTPEPHPVVTVEDVGGGTVLVVGDAALATNGGLDREDNAALLANGYADADRVVLLAPGADDPPPLATLQERVLDRVGS